MANTQKFVNNFSSTITNTPGTSGTSIILASVTGLDGALGGGDFYLMTMVTGTGFEIVKVTAVATGTNTLTVVRGQEGTSQDLASGDVAEVRNTAATYDNFVQATEFLPAVQKKHPGEFIWHMPHISGAKTIAQMQALGWALCDGSTPASQSVSGGTLAITAATPDLCTAQRFIRAHSSTSGTLEADSYKSHNHAFRFRTGTSTYTNYDYLINITGGVDYGAGLYIDQVYYSGYDSNSNNALDIAVSGGTETRPINVTAVPMIYCLTD